MNDDDLKSTIKSFLSEKRIKVEKELCVNKSPYLQYLLTNHSYERDEIYSLLFKMILLDASSNNTHYTKQLGSLEEITQYFIDYCINQLDLPSDLVKRKISKLDFVIGIEQEVDFLRTIWSRHVYKQFGDNYISKLSIPLFFSIPMSFNATFIRIDKNKIEIPKKKESKIGLLYCILLYLIIMTMFSFICNIKSYI